MCVCVCVCVYLFICSYCNRFKNVTARNEATEVGKRHLVLVEGGAKRQLPGGSGPALTGRTNNNKRIVFSNLVTTSSSSFTFTSSSSSMDGMRMQSESNVGGLESSSPLLKAGDYAEVVVTGVTGHTLRGRATAISSIAQWHRNGNDAPGVKSNELLSR